MPDRARDWATLLGTLTAQLRDPSSPLAREHYDHHHLHTALTAVLAALDTARPGGLDRLAHPRQR